MTSNPTGKLWKNHVGKSTSLVDCLTPLTSPKRSLSSSRSSRFGSMVSQDTLTLPEFEDFNASKAEFGDFDAPPTPAQDRTSLMIASATRAIEADDDSGFGEVTVHKINHQADDRRKKLVANGFNMGRAKIVRMLSSRSIQAELNDDDDDGFEEDNSGGSFGDDLSVVHSVGSCYTEATSFTASTVGTFGSSHRSLTRSSLGSTSSRRNSLTRSCFMSDLSLADDDVNPDLQKELEQLPAADLATKFVALREQLAKQRKKKKSKRRKKKVKSSSEEVAMGKRSSRRRSATSSTPSTKTRRSSVAAGA